MLTKAINDVIQSKKAFKLIPFNKTIGKGYMIKKNNVIEAIAKAKLALRNTSGASKDEQFQKMNDEQKKEFFNLQIGV